MSGDELLDVGIELDQWLLILTLRARYDPGPGFCLIDKDAHLSTAPWAWLRARFIGCQEPGSIFPNDDLHT